MNIYLASPYSHPDAKVRQQRFEAVCKKAAELMLAGHNVFSPVAHSHPISLHLGNSLENQFWLRQDITFLIKWADEMWVLTLDGWKESKGIEVETKVANRKGLPVVKVSP